MRGGKEFGQPAHHHDTGANLDGGSSPEFSQDYRQAIAGLNRFRSVDTTTLQTLKDTSFATSLVGYHLRTIIHERGQSFLRKSYFASFEPGLSVSYESGNPMLSIRDLEDRVLIKTFTEPGGVSQKEYQVSAPASQDLPLTDINQETRTFSNFSFTDAVEWHSAERRDYTDYAPVLHPDSPGQQQGYARILQEVVGKVLAVVPQPT